LNVNHSCTPERIRKNVRDKHVRPEKGLEKMVYAKSVTLTLLLTGKVPSVLFLIVSGMRR
jgi:hypothetical protein